MEIESIEFEQKQLYKQWNSSLIGMMRRDEALVAARQDRVQFYVVHF